jgi:indolepyruvate ferredoxin oxidoreductase
MGEKDEGAQPCAVTLDDKWTLRKGRIFLNGTQAIARALLAQKDLDDAAGKKTAGYVSGYRGSPLGNVDTTLWSIGDRLRGAAIRFVPGVNEDMAATAIRGTQQLAAVPDPLVDGVFAAWYGKGPGVDRSGDALKHGNFHGAHPQGGVLVFYGDDHGGKSSSIAHHSEQAMAAALIPSFYPADLAEIIEYSLLGYALSRYSGSWVGMKLVNEMAEQTATIDVDIDAFAAVLPPAGPLPPEGVHARPRAFGPLREERIVIEHRLPMVADFVRANPVDRTIFRAEAPRLGLVTAGKSHGDTMQALRLLGLDAASAAALGVSLFKVGCIWPLEPTKLAGFAQGHETLFFIEEKQAFVEPQAAALLINQPVRARLIGKRDEEGRPLLPQAAQLEPVGIALAIAGRLRALGIASAAVEDAARALGAMATVPSPADAVPKRSPYFCSGCPHSRSTRIPEGSLSMTGIGCHTMATFVRPHEALPPTHMGGEGGNWTGLAAFTATPHIFQNMGDGTYYHSGLIAIRAAVASGVNITYKILYNDAVAMTGGQAVDGPISVPEIAQQVRHEGVDRICIVSDTPETWQGHAGLPAGVTVHHRDDLEAVQVNLRGVPGCSVLIYEQTCAAEKRRRRKQGRFPDPARRLFIAEAVCEGCGDCSAQSTCVSLFPAETDLGTKRRIDQSSCNKDFSCLDGFCPSFITVCGAEVRKPQVSTLDPALFANLPPPAAAPLGRDSYNVMICGIGGTGVITVSAIIGMAAHIEGRAASIFDMTGLSQKNGAVFSHVRIAGGPVGLHTPKLGAGEADVLLAMDAVAALADDARQSLGQGRTRALVSSNAAPTAAFQFDRDAKVDAGLLIARLKRGIGAPAVQDIDASAIALDLLGDTIGANMLVVGVAAQRGMLPVGIAALEAAIRLNGTAVAFNLAAFRLGRLLAVAPSAVEAMRPGRRVPAVRTLAEVVDGHARRLVDYQDDRLAARYRSLVDRVAQAEQAVAPGSDVLTQTVARNYARILAYKDEYEVARLLSSEDLWDRLGREFGDGGRFAFNMAPPLLSRKGRNGRPRKRAFDARLWRPVLRMLSHGRRLRGTAFDPFGYTQERRSERGFIAHYELLVGQTVARLTPGNVEDAAKLLDRAAGVRGYGPVKDEAMAAYFAGLDTAVAAFADGTA